MSAKSTFAVGIAGGGMQSGVIYLDLATLSLDKRDDKGNPLKEVGHRVYLTPEAALETFHNLKGVLDRLAQMGVLTKKDAEGQPGPAKGDGGDGGDDGSQSPRSPNFSDS